VNATPPVNGAVVYLCCSGEEEVEDLELSLILLAKYFTSQYPAYPVIVLHDYLTDGHLRRLHTLLAATPLRPRYVELLPDQWQGATPSDVDPSVKIFRYGMGYRHMCRLFSGPLLASLPALAPFDWLLRLDTDSFLLGPVTRDPFQVVSFGAFKYGWIGAFKDEPYFVTGLGDLTTQWMRESGLKPAVLQQWLGYHLALEGIHPSEGSYDDVRFCFATNFFIVSSKFLQSPEMWSFFRTLDDSGGFYRYRWGDACVHFLAVAALLDRDRDTVQLHMDVPYWHQGTVSMPESNAYFTSDKY